MKNIKKYILVMLVMGLGACEDFLNTEPKDFLSPNNYYETADHLNFARMSMYHILGTSPLWASAANYLYAWEGDIAYMNRATLTAGPWNYNYSPADGYVANLWSILFNGVNRTNVVLANVDKNPDINESYRNQIRGEAYFLRGFFYFLLVKNYGGVPLFTSPTASINTVDLPRASIREVYDQIIIDMQAAEPLVADIADLGFGGQISKSAVRGILARVNLHMAGVPLNDPNGYVEARKWAKMVMDDASAQHELNPQFHDIFRNYAADQYDIKESIWEVEFWGNRTDQYVETTNNAWINGPFSRATSETGRADSYMSITAPFYNVFEPGDARKYVSIAHFTYLPTGPNGAKDLIPRPTAEVQKYALRPGKWRREWETLFPKAPTTSPQNVPLLRFADVLLMFAEAENEVNGGPTADAINAVNAVRRRGWSKGVKTITVTSEGSGYSDSPEIIFSSGNGSDASATAIVENGQIVDIVLDREPDGLDFYQGGEYTSPPTITISDPTGTGASAEAEIYEPEDADATPQQIASKESFLQLIQNERMKEFALEGLRKGDLLRWGIFFDVMAEMANTIQQDAPGVFYFANYNNVQRPRDLFFPIPISELSVNEAMTQNPGWE